MKVWVIMGGISSEREISLQSGEQVLLNLNKDKYEEIIPIIIDSKSEVIEKVKYDVEFKKEEISDNGTKTILAGGWFLYLYFFLLN